MLPDRVSNPGPLTYESGALPIALCGRAGLVKASPMSQGNSSILRVSTRNILPEQKIYAIIPSFYFKMSCKCGLLWGSKFY